MCTMRNRAKSYRHHNSIHTLSQWTSLYDPRFIDFQVFCGIIFFSVVVFFPWIFLDAVWVDYWQFGFLTYKNNFFDVWDNSAELVKWLLIIFISSVSLVWTQVRNPQKCARSTPTPFPSIHTHHYILFPKINSIGFYCFTHICIYSVSLIFMYDCVSSMKHTMTWAN